MLSLKLLLNVLSILGALFAIWKGGAAERYGAFVVIANVVIGQTWHFLAPAQDDMVRLINDGITALVLLGITVRYSALWMGGVMLLFAVQFSLHSYYLVAERRTDHLYAVINNVDFNGVIFFLVAGTAVAWRRRIRARHGASI
jgi:hypothetical protein